MRQLIKPKHKGTVIATEKGWVVKETGEILVSFKGLSTILANQETESESPQETENSESETENLDFIDDLEDIDDNDTQDHETELKQVKLS